MKHLPGIELPQKNLGLAVKGMAVDEAKTFSHRLGVHGIPPRSKVAVGRGVQPKLPTFVEVLKREVEGPLTSHASPWFLFLPSFSCFCFRIIIVLGGEPLGCVCALDALASLQDHKPGVAFEPPTQKSA